MRRAQIEQCIATVLACALVACAEPAASSSDADGGADAGENSDSGTHNLRVLFIGNSYTSVNNLPSVVASLGEMAEPEVHLEVAAYTPGGQTWQGHDADPAVTELIAQGWDFVVLQDQSQQPWWGPPVDVKPELLSLDAKVRAAGAETVLYMTWAPASDYFAYSMLVDSYYEQAGEAVGARVAPVGRAWERALRDPTMTLHADDGSHPNARGTYLAACVLLATLTPVDLQQNLGNGGLDVNNDDAAALRAIAQETIRARQQPTAPLLGSWPLSSASIGSDLIPSHALTLGDSTGADGSASSATSFGPDRFAGIPYFAGINTSELKLSFDMFRADWSVPPLHRETVIDRSVSYTIFLEGTSLTAAIVLPRDDASAAGSTPTADPNVPSPLVPVHPPPAPETMDLTIATAGLAVGWHRIMLTHDGSVAALSIDGAEVAAAPTGHRLGCSESERGCNVGIALGIQSEATISRVAPELLTPFTGALANVELGASAR